MSAQPKWLTDMGDAGGVPLIVAEGDEEGAIVTMSRDDAEAADAAGTHIIVEGRDMATFDLAQERAKRTTCNRAMTTDDRHDEQPTQVVEPKDAAKPKRMARVGRYSNRAMTTRTTNED